MSTFRAACPSCKVKVNVSNSGDDLTRVTCDACGKIFDVRLPKTKPAKAVQDSLFDMPLPDLACPLPKEALDWNNYRARRQPFVATRPLVISLGIVAVLATLVGVGALVLQQAPRIDVVAIGGSILNGPDDSRERILQDWLQCSGEQKTILHSITRKSDCQAAAIPMERLQEKQLMFVVRAAVLEYSGMPTFKASDLPPAPQLMALSDRSFRTIETALTPEFREAEEKLNTYANAVLSYLHVEATGLPVPKDEFEKHLFHKIAVKRSLCRLLAKAHRNTDESDTAVAIYELAEELKRLRSAFMPAAELESTMPPRFVYADYSSDRLRTVLADRFKRTPDCEIAKAIAAIEQCLEERPSK